jgi:inositol-1,3,4-trisphosphate 5/6-kinase/inositol-tetrakisphosphate 1-kinase
MTIFQRDLALIRREEQRCGRRVLIIDPLEAVYCLMDRVQFSSALDALLASGKLDAWSAQQREKNRQEQVSDVRLTKWCAGTADHGAQMFSRACRETIMARLRNVDTSKPDGQKRSSPAQESDCAASHDALERKGSRKEKGFVTPEGLANDRTSCIETSLGTLEFRRPIPWIQACALADLRYPLVVKRRTACGPRSSHDLALVYDPEGLEALLSDSPQLVGPRNPTQRSPFRHDEIYIQEYIPHGHAVFKVYVIGCESQASIHARSTLPIPQETDHGYRLLNTYDFGKDAISEQETGSGDNAGALWYPPPPSKDDASRLARFVIEHLQVTLFGLDIVRSAVDGALYIVDLNYFPSFKDVPDAHLQLLRYLRFRLESAI